MSTKVEEAIAEIQAALDEALPLQEGLKDYLALNLKPATRTEVMAAKVIADRRVLKLQAALAACVELMSDGYPEVPVRPVEAEVLVDLQENEETLRVALSKFAQAQAASLNLGASVGEPK